MQFSDTPFHPESQLFPSHQTVTEYLEAYSKDVEHLIHFETQVLDLRQRDHAKAWTLETRNIATGNTEVAEYDAVIVASGHFNVPNIPPIKGVAQWNKAYPGSVSHSKFYRTPDAYKDKKVIVVGNAASGLDISGQIRSVCKPPIMVSQKSPSYLSTGDDNDKVEMPEIVEFLPSCDYNRAVLFQDGHIEDYVDAVLFCTGYFYSFPFLGSLRPPVVTNGTRTERVYQHMFYEDSPTLAFVALPHKVIPFPLSEAQAAVIARVWSGRLTLPSKEAMVEWEQTQIEERDGGRGFHALGFPLDADYLNNLRSWAESSIPRPGLERGGRGKIGPHWGEKERWMRERFPAIRKAFVNRGDERRNVHFVEELGFDYDAWRAEQDSAEKII